MTTRAARRGAARRKRRASPPRGGCPAATIRCAVSIYWGIANPTPNTRMVRHGGNVDAIPTFAPADLYSNSTVALNPDTGKLAWYYQHLPGDDWDEDYTHERTLFRTAVSPDPKFVKWINPDVRRGQQRDVMVMVGEGGGMWALDRDERPVSVGVAVSVRRQELHHFEHRREDRDSAPEHRSAVQGAGAESHAVLLEHAQLLAAGVSSRAERAVRAVRRQLSRHDVGRTRSRTVRPAVPERRVGSRRSGVELDNFAGVVKVNMSTGETEGHLQGRAPGNGAMLATAGDLVFWGDLDGKLRAFDAASGKDALGDGADRAPCRTARSPMP